MIVQKKDLAAAQDMTALPVRQFKAAGRFEQRPRDRFAIDQDGLVFAANFIAGQASDLLDQWPASPCKSMPESPESSQRSGGDDGPPVRGERAVASPVKALRRTLRPVPDQALLTGNHAGRARVPSRLQAGLRRKTTLYQKLSTFVANRLQYFMPTILKSDVFEEWIDNLRARAGAAQVLRRLARLERGNPGRVAPVGEGVSELKIDFGPG